MASEATGLTLPTSLPYPIRITQIIAQPTSSISRGSPILEYTFTSATSQKALDRQKGGLPPQEGDKDAREGDMVGSWDSELEGEVERIAQWITVGAVIDRTSAGKSAAWVLQACDHSVQFGGMCALCGADMTQGDYMTRPQEDHKAGASKKLYAMTHDAGGVTVSEKEAKLLETQDQSNLLGARKLSLIVDLDQTIIHTTVEPTVGEWLDEIAAGIAAAQSSSTSSEGGEETTTPPGSPRVKERNPNEKALRDVARFQLSDDLPPGYDPKGKGKIPPGHERWYYTKPRPGLNHFLAEMNTMYEMHVYTMGTRSYADAICKAIDPEGKFFGTRILSRDESGSSFVKDLQRLFPTDRNMAVIIDDRADVWKNDLSNLVKVIPYDFFGIGDINASFLPPRTDQPVPSSPASSASTPPPQTPSSSSSSDTDVSPMEENLIAKSKMLDELSESRPLAKLQEQLDKEAEGDVATEGSDATGGGEAGSSDKANSARGGSDSPTGTGKTERSTTPPGSPSQSRGPLLNPNDDELKRVGTILSRIHRSWYSEYDRRKNRQPGATLPLGCDVATIISDIRAEVFDSCRFIFSGVIPLGTKAEDSDVWSTADSFGATVTNDARDMKITHCITATEGTEKVYRSRRNGAKVVWMDWFHRCVALWERVNEQDWLVLAPKKDVQGEESKGEASRPGSGSATPKTDALGLQSTTGLAEDGKESGMADGENSENGDADAEWGGLGQDELDALMREAAEAGDEDSDDGSNFGTEGTGDVPTSPLRSILGSPRHSRAGSVDSDASQPGTPKKRVRYADEMDLPLESFKDASPDDAEDRPKKRARALLMPPGESDIVPDSNKFKYKTRDKEVGGDIVPNGVVAGAGTCHEDPDEPDASGEGQGGDGEDPGEQEDEDEDDEFAALLHAETD